MLAFLAFFSHTAVETPVRATLSDGQVLMGEVKTRTLRLESGSGLLEIPIEDIGEVVPVSVDGLGESEGYVDVWLRNGSELRGRWSQPKLEMGIAVGGAEVPVDLPMNELSRFQLQGGSAWPSEPVFRMKTAWGDDFLVDPARTRIVVENQLGSFGPLLSECRSAAPVGDPAGNWRIVLATGTVLIGKLRDQALTVALPMGPEEITVPLEQFVSLRLERWAPTASIVPPVEVAPRTEAEEDGYGARAAGRNLAVDQPARPVPPASGGLAAPMAAPAGDGWFDRGALDAAKDANQP